VRRRHQNQKVHFTKTPQVEILRSRVGDGADLREEAPGHAQLRGIDLEDLAQELHYRKNKQGDVNLVRKKQPNIAINVSPFIHR